MTTIIMTAHVRECPIVLTKERPAVIRRRIDPRKLLLSYFAEHFTVYCMVSLAVLPVLMTALVAATAFAAVTPIALLFGLY